MLIITIINIVIINNYHKWVLLIHLCKNFDGFRYYSKYIRTVYSQASAATKAADMPTALRFT